MTYLPFRPHAQLLVLALCAGACTDAPNRPTREAPPEPGPADRSASEAPKAVEMPEPLARRLGVPRDQSRTIKPLEGAPEGDLRTAEPFKRGAPEAPPEERAEPAARGFLGKPDAEVLERLRSGQLQSATKAASGGALAFEVTLDSGVEGYYKPEQRRAGASWSAEVAAFYLDRALALDRVPGVVSRKLAWKPLEAAAGSDARKRAVVIDKEAQVRGALIAWPSEPEKLAPVELPAGWEDWIRVEPRTPSDVTPYQSQAAYKRALVEARKRTGPAGTKPAATKPAAATPDASATSIPKTEAPTPARPELPAELSDMIVFDYLTANADRFEARENLVALGDGGPLIALHNGAAFGGATAQHALLEARLAFVSKFRRRTIEALRALDIEALRATMAADSLGPLLDSAAWRALAARRTAVLEHVARLEQRFGGAVYAW